MKSGSLFTPPPPPDEFDKFYAEVIEPDVRLSTGGKGADRRSDKLGLGAGVVVSVASVLWLRFTCMAVRPGICGRCSPGARGYPTQNGRRRYDGGGDSRFGGETPRKVL